MHRFSVVAALVTFATTVAGQSTEESLRRVDAEWARSYAQHDTVTAKALFDDRLIVTSGTGVLKNKEGELADVRPTAGMQMHYFRTSDVQVRAIGTTAAAVAGLAEWSFTYNGRTSTVRRRYTATYAQGGRLGWSMIALQIGPAPAG